ncbi:MAG: hypothetical protein A2X23_10040 [Chloroflexi bacterium GWC2_73_18]|nr:MAG: hypothetical protein A2X23_10040 [Chloroflexi bacterium GWC2_73_18]
MRNILGRAMPLLAMLTFAAFCRSRWRRHLRGTHPGDPVMRLRQLAELRDAGLLTEAEFEAKKVELLARM